MDKIWYYSKGTGENFGPYTEEEISRLLEQRILTEDDYIWTSVLDDWLRIGDSIYSFYLPEDEPENI